MNNQSVPAEIKTILTYVTDPAEIAQNTQTIVKQITTHSGGMFHRNKPLPPFLTPFFRAVSLAELDDHALQPLLNQGVHPAAMLHMKTCRTFWVGKDVNVTTLINAGAKSYITLKDALNLSEGAVMPKHIIATEDEIRSKAHFSAIDTLFKTYPNHELVIDFEEAESFHAFGNKDDDKLFPESLRNISFVGRNLTTIGDFCFTNLPSLTSLTIPKSVITIGDGCFMSLRSLTSFTIPSSVRTIGISCCTDFSCLTSLTISEGVTVIGRYSFRNLSSLISLTIPGSLKAIERGCFRELSNLTSLKISEGVTTIEHNCFTGLSVLEEYTDPDSLTTIGENSFSRPEKQI